MDSPSALAPRTAPAANGAPAPNEIPAPLKMMLKMMGVDPAQIEVGFSAMMKYAAAAQETTDTVKRIEKKLDEILKLLEAK